MSAASAEPQYITPTPWERARFLLAWGAFYAWLFSHVLWLPSAVARIDTPDTCASLGTLQFLAGYVIVVSAIPALLFGWKAWHTRHATQCPPPGSWVLFRTRIYTARWWVTANKLALAAMVVAFAAMPVVIWRELGMSTIFFNHGC